MPPGAAPGANGSSLHKGNGAPTPHRAAVPGGGGGHLPTPPPGGPETPPPPVMADVPIDTDATPPPAAGAPGGRFSGGVPMSGPAPLLSSGPVGPGFPMAPFSGPVAAPPQPKKSRALPIVLGALALLIVAAAIVHVEVMPLPLLVVWTKPATLSIDSQPAGADVILDGRPVIGQTPTRTTVKRDHADHDVAISKAGYKNAHTTVRYDHVGDLTAAVTLEALPPPPPPPPTPAAQGGAREGRGHGGGQARTEGRGARGAAPQGQEGPCRPGEQGQAQGQARQEGPPQEVAGPAGRDYTRPLFGAFRIQQDVNEPSLTDLMAAIERLREEVRAFGEELTDSACLGG